MLACGLRHTIAHVLKRQKNAPRRYIGYDIRVKGGERQRVGNETERQRVRKRERKVREIERESKGKRVRERERG